MSDPRITDEAIEAAAKAIYETPHDSLSRDGYDRAPRDIQKLYLAEAEAALEAALPHLAPQPQPVDREALERLVNGANHYDTCDVALSPLTNQHGCSCLLADLRALLNGSQS